MGVVNTSEALQRARAQDLDLVEVAPMAVPPVCRIMDFGKYQYQEQKRAREARRHRRRRDLDEVEALLPGDRQRLRRRHDAELLARVVDHADFPYPDALVGANAIIATG